MATGLKNWSTTAADNDDADSTINWLEGQLPSTVNNSARAMMAVLAADAVRSEDADTSLATVASTTTETDVYTYSVPANTLGSNRMIRVTAFGTYQTTLNQIITIRLIYGSTTVATRTVTSSTATDFVFRAYLCAAGSTSAQKGVLEVEAVADYGTAAEDSTTALNLKLSADPSNNSASDTITFHIVQTEVI